MHTQIPHAQQSKCANHLQQQRTDKMEKVQLLKMHNKLHNKLHRLHYSMSIEFSPYFKSMWFTHLLQCKSIDTKLYYTALKHSLKINKGTFMKIEQAIQHDYRGSIAASQLQASQLSPELMWLSVCSFSYSACVGMVLVRRPQFPVTFQKTSQ